MEKFSIYLDERVFVMKDTDETCGRTADLWLSLSEDTVSYGAAYIFRALDTLSIEAPLSKLLAFILKMCLHEKERICSYWEKILVF